MTYFTGAPQSRNDALRAHRDFPGITIHVEAPLPLTAKEHLRQQSLLKAHHEDEVNEAVRLWQAATGRERAVERAYLKVALIQLRMARGRYFVALKASYAAAAAGKRKEAA